MWAALTLPHHHRSGKGDTASAVLLDRQLSRSGDGTGWLRRVGGTASCRLGGGCRGVAACRASEITAPRLVGPSFPPTDAASGQANALLDPVPARLRTSTRPSGGAGTTACLAVCACPPHHGSPTRHATTGRPGLDEGLVVCLATGSAVGSPGRCYKRARPAEMAARFALSLLGRCRSLLVPCRLLGCLLFCFLVYPLCRAC